MKLLRNLICLHIVLFLSLPLIGCGNAGTPDQGATGPVSPPVTKDDIQKIDAGRGQMGPTETSKK